MKIDKVDNNIVTLLKEDGRLTNNEIARRLGISEGTVRNRMRNLMANGIMCVRGLRNPEKFEDKKLMYLCAKIAVSKDLNKAAAVIAGMNNVQSVCVISGRYDLLIEVFIEPHLLIQFIANDLGKIGSVVSTESFLTLKSYGKWI